MNEFLEKLSGALGSMSLAQKQEILADYREHFEAGFAAGKTEAQITQDLGDPKQIGRMYQADFAVERAKKALGLKNVLQMLGAVVQYKLLGGLVIVCLYIVAVALTVSFFAAAIGILAAGSAVFAAGIVTLIRGYQIYALLASFVTLSLFCMGLLGCSGSAGLWKRTVLRLPVLASRLMRKGLPKEAK